MTADLLLALAAFAFVASITPGPNNLMLLASGANFGLRASLPHMLGIGLGHAFMVAVVGLGLAGLFAAWPPLHLALKVASVAYMAWLAWRIAHAAAPVRRPEGADAAAETGGRPLTFLEAAAFQWVNPKAWAMALTAVTVYLPGAGAGAGADIGAVLAVAGVFCAVNLPSVATWAALGVQLRRLLTSPARLRMFNWTMAALLILSLAPVLAA
jgi:threonine/homoserine/homoserine lactone efflux protein